MSRLLNKIGSFLAGNQKDLVLENKIFNIIAFLAAFTCFSTFITNLFVGFPLIFNVLLLLCGVVFVLFFYLSVYRKITKPLEIPLQVVAISLLIVVWFFNQGIEGSGPFYFYLVTFAFIYSNSKKKYWTILFIYLLLAIILVLMNSFYPEFMFYYSNKTSQILDLSANLIISLAILGITAILLKQNYDRERSKVEKNAAQLKSLNATKDKFFSIISHDLRNPFNNLLGISRHLKANIDNYTSEEIRENVALIEESSKRGYELLENLLEWSMSQTGSIKFKPIKLCLPSVIQECLLVLENQVANKKINLITEVDKDIEVIADFNMLKIIIRNLLTNAFKYSNPGGKVIIRSEFNTKNEIEISVIDEGIGIPDEEIEKLFRIDTKYSTPGTSDEFGTGLGLILCKEFVEKHNGKIWVESKLNSGSIFKFTLPR
jgi:two-component system, sensor histidine kinase and response regulator